MHGLSADFNAFIETGTLRSEAGITVDTQGLNIVSGGASVTTGTLLAPDGLTINSTANIQLVNAHSSHASFGDTTLQVITAAMQLQFPPLTHTRVTARLRRCCLDPDPACPSVIEWPWS